MKGEVVKRKKAGAEDKRVDHKIGGVRSMIYKLHIVNY